MGTKKWLIEFVRTNMGVALLAIALAVTTQPVAVAQSANELAEQQAELVKQYMEAAGMSAEEVAGQEEMFRKTMGPLVEAQAAQEAREQADFEARAVGKAVISVPGKDIELQVTECLPAPDGNFHVKAQENHDSRSDSLSLGGESYYDRTILQMFLKGVGEYDIWIQPLVNLKDGRFAWSGTAEDGTEVTVTVDCDP